MNILFISHTAGGGGGETVLTDIIRIVAQNTDHRIFVALPNDGNNEFTDRLGDMARFCVIKRFAFRPVRNTLIFLARNLGYGLLLGLPRLKNFIRTNAINLVYVNSSVNVIGAMAASAAKQRYIWHIHEQSTDSHRWAPKWFNRFYRNRILSNACRPVFVSKTNYKLWLDDLHIDKIENSRILYSPYKEIAVAKRNNNPFTFGFMGTLNANKNLGTLIEAFGRLKGDYRLLIGGNGECASAYRKKAEHDTRIEFLGYVANPQTFYSLIDSLVLVSLNESWGLVVLEAMSAGLPVVMTRNTGLTELFENGRECVFVEPSSVEEIANSMLLLAQNEELRKAMVRNASEKLQIENMNVRFTSEILKIINEQYGKI